VPFIGVVYCGNYNNYSRQSRCYSSPADSHKNSFNNITIVFAVDVVKTRYLSDRKGFFRDPFHCIAFTFQQDGVIGFMKVRPRKQLCLTLADWFDNLSLIV
jgi:hypothetical protein